MNNPIQSLLKSIAAVTALLFSIGIFKARNLGQIISVRLPSQANRLKLKSASIIAFFTLATLLGPIVSPVNAQSSDRLNVGQKLLIGQELKSPNGRFSLRMQHDENLVLYDTGVAGTMSRFLWASNTAGTGANYAIMQPDGNFVLYTSENRPVWASDTYASGGLVIILQNDANLVVYRADDAAVWASDTYIPNFNPNAVYFNVGGKLSNTSKSMWAWGSLVPSTGYLAFSQRAKNVVWLVGYKGCAQLFFVDAQNVIIGRSPVYRLGVDGTIFGDEAANRTRVYLSTDPGGFWVPINTARRTVSVNVLLFHCPNNLVQGATQFVGHLEDATKAVVIIAGAVGKALLAAGEAISYLWG